MKIKFILTFLLLLFLTGCQGTPKGSSLTPTTDQGPTATAPADGDDTSTPSPPEDLLEPSGDHQVLQEGNSGPAYMLNTYVSNSLLDNHSGAWTGGFDLYDDPEFFFENGFKHIRIGGLYHPDQTGWPVRADTLVEEINETITEYADNGVTVVLATQTGSGLPFPMDEFTQDDIDIMVDYVTFLANHFQGRIEYYEIYNEFGHIYKIDTYANLVSQTTDRIKQLDPNAKVIMGAVPGNWYNGEPGYGAYQRFVLDTCQFLV